MRGSVQRRGKNRWRLVFDMGRDNAGRRRQKVVTTKGSKRAAEQRLAELVKEVEDDGFIEPTHLTVSAYLDIWLDHVATKTSAKTHERYEEIVKLGIVPHLGNIKLSKLRPIHVQSFYAEALKSGRKHRPGGLSTRTVLHYHRILSQSLKHAIALKLISRNPVEEIAPPKPEQKEMVVLDEDQTAELLSEVAGTPLFMPVLLAVTTGMRRGEVLALRWSNVDLKHGALSVTQTLEKSRKGGLRFKAPKTKKSRRSVALPSITIEALGKLRAEQAETCLRIGCGWDEKRLICARSDGAPINPNTLTSGFASFVRRLDIPKVTFHGLRHTHATQLLKEGIHPKVAQERLGHSNIATTIDLYSHVTPGMQQDAAIRVDKALKAALGKRTDGDILA